jgi:hypothetical protein
MHFRHLDSQSQPLAQVLSYQVQLPIFCHFEGCAEIELLVKTCYHHQSNPNRSHTSQKQHHDRLRQKNVHDLKRILKRSGRMSGMKRKEEKYAGKSDDAPKD